MPPTRRKSLGRRTRNTASQRNIRANQTDEQREARNELERNRYQDRNVVFNPHRAAFSYNVAIDYSSDQIVAIGLNPCFSHGQLYVACSRVGKPSTLFIYAPEHKTKNIVYQKALE